MLAPHERRNRRKLLISAVTLAGVLIVAGVAQRNYQPVDPFATEGTRARTEPPAAAPDQRPVFGSGTSRPDALSQDPLPRETPAAAPAEQTPEATAKRDGVPADVLGLIERWRSTLERGDLATH